ncbi:DUF4189 domain-containing protein [Nocardia sp. NPDC050630]|uniref:DUF4189 domain-containing protein n=1 Tax=Nocardia sp. NPDC050630 TaxID=3364321 RepID=UPI0037961430
MPSTVLAVFALCMLTGTASPAQAQSRNNYGAIAVSPSTGYYGWSYDYPSYVAAEAAAVTNCITHGGASDCDSKISWRNGCGALSTSRNFYGYGSGASPAAAKSRAMANNPEPATIEHWNCTSGYTL